MTVVLIFRLDVNECEIQVCGLTCYSAACGPATKCTNTIGSFACACSAGYTGDGVTCTGKFRNKTR